ncbi:MAG: poly(beta-D-mannuronate) lyase, partial [Ralstonia sp.]|nr:poly(beta-D-mannuronate) lyase [Ralstonia sp.]MBA4296088.1 poly(beta-D-mannuronate) lyase [Ralstonia sp.]
MRRAYVRTLLAFSLVVGAGFGLVHAARACEIPAPVQTIDPPGFYD